MGVNTDVSGIKVITESSTDLLITPAWDALAASAGTVFHTRRFLLAWWDDRVAKSPQSRFISAEVRDHGHVIGACAFELSSGVLSFAGGRDVVDYMGPIAVAGREKDVAAALADQVIDDLPWQQAHLAGLAHDDAAAMALTDEVARRAPSAIIEKYDEAPRIEHTSTGYLALLNSKRRADVQRKRNRLTEAVGEMDLVVSTPETALASLDQLLAWKADASPATRDFVAEYGAFMHALVTSLAAVDAAHVVELRAGNRPLAAAITLRHANTEYLYNMSYDMTFTTAAHAGLAPGVVLVSHLVERALDRGLRFDFLKGAQDYKLRLGGVPVDLIGISMDNDTPTP